MPVTFVSAFIDLKEDRSKDKSPERCMTLFRQLAECNIRLHLFLSASFREMFEEVCGTRPNVHVQYIELEDLTTYKEVDGISMLPPVRTEHHDTKNFLILMNAKIEFIYRAMEAAHFPATHYAWIDFSIFHVFRNHSDTRAYLEMLGASRLIPKCLIMPGCWERGYGMDRIFQAVNWRFCGGFFLGDTVSLKEMYDATLKLLCKGHGLIWEVNFWAHMENMGAIQPRWVHADHNDSIVQIPREFFSVVASLTTIPPRIATECRLAINLLLHQVEHVYVSVSDTYKRFGEWEVPAYFSEEPYASHVTLHRTEDKGPATKYLGALDIIPSDAWVFVCDDDQEYHPDLILRMKRALSGLAVYQNHYEHIKLKTSGGLIHGYVGLLVHMSQLKGLQDFPLPPCAYFVDDQWMSIYCFKNEIPIKPTGVELYRDIYAVLQNAHEKIGAASLAGLQNRDEKVAELAAELGVKFERENIYPL